MKTIGWMLSLLGSLIGGFTAWAERMPSLQMHLILPHGSIPGPEVTLIASAVGLISVVLMWFGLYPFGGIFVIVAAIIGFFGADQLWATAGCTLFVGALLAIFGSKETSSPENPHPQ